MTDIFYEKTSEVDLSKKEAMLNGEFDMSQYYKSKVSSKSPTKNRMKTPNKNSSRTDTIFEVKLA